jgi:hypothetical protein
MEKVTEWSGSVRARAITEIRPDENTSDVPRFSILMWKGAAGVFIEEDDGTQGTAI